MDERGALRVIDGLVAAAGNDAAVVDGLALTVDMLHAETDYPAGVTHFTAGWRSVAVSLSDLAAVGATPLATLTVYAPERFEPERLEAFVNG
ncbi:MAG: AIR synthase related protein, partial [Halobacteriota archaeon]